MKNFEELIKEYSSKFKSKNDVIKGSNDFFIENYLSNSKYSSFSLPFVSGTIYSFEYKTPSTISKDRKFINRNPIFIFLNYVRYNNENVLHGIDLSVIPMDIRQFILSKIWDSFNDQIIKNSEIKYPKSPLLLSSENLNSLLSKSGYNKAIFGFKYNYFSNIKEIKSQDWVRIPFLELNKFEGLNTSEIYKEYRSKLK
jgi:hypothetical protein